MRAPRLLTAALLALVLVLAAGASRGAATQQGADAASRPLRATVSLRGGDDEAGDPLIYDSPLVTPGPGAPLQVRPRLRSLPRGKARAFGAQPARRTTDAARAHACACQNGSDSFRFEDARGAYERRSFAGGEYVNLVYTRAGFLRSGDVHKCEQLNHIVFGRATLTQLRRGRETATQLRGGDVVRIPPHVPHLYAFHDDSLMTETWRHPDGTPCEFRAWLYKPLRDRIPPASAVKRFDAGGK